MTIIPYDDRDGFIWMNGQMLPWRDARVHFLTHGLHYGSAVFEGLRCYGGKIFKLNEHSQRLLDSCRIMDMKIGWSVEQINQACLDAVKANDVQEGYIRPLAWRGPEQMGVAAQAAKINLAVAAWEWPHYFAPEARDKGISVKTSRWRRPPPDCAPVSAKAAGLYMVCTLAKHDAENSGFNDALMLDYRGHVAELSAANLFMVKDCALHTAPPECFLNGITRLTVMHDIAPKLGLQVIERTIMPDELMQADEVFATGTAAEITPITKIDDKVFNFGPITRQVRDAYADMVRKS